MKSGWSEDLTDIYFFCGTRDVAARYEPNHFHVFKAGRMVLGTNARYYDHGTPVPADGNVVVVGGKTPTRWLGYSHWPRMHENTRIDRYAVPNLAYQMRDWATTGMKTCPWIFLAPVAAILLHSHAEHPFQVPGRIVAYETSPEYDYVAGDATRAWPVDKVGEMYRQLVFLRPDTIVVYDRGRLRKGAGGSCWRAVTASNVSAKDGRFVINGKSSCRGVVLLPERGGLTAKPGQGKTKYGQLNIKPAKDTDKVEYLVVMRVFDGPPGKLNARLLRSGESVGVGLELGSRKASILFDSGPAPGGSVAIEDGKHTVKRDLAGGVNMSYKLWAKDPRYVRWMTDSRFVPYVTEKDRRDYAAEISSTPRTKPVKTD